MKFVLAVVMLACAVSVQSSLVGQYAPAVSYVTSAVHPSGAWGGPWGGAWAGPSAWAGGHGGWNGWNGAPAAVAVHAGGPWGHSGPSGWGVPGISLSQGPGHAAAPLGLALGHGHGHEGVYVAKTRGAVHTAPLAGHINSATSLNLAAAPGTH